MCTCFHDLITKSLEIRKNIQENKSQSSLISSRFFVEMFIFYWKTMMVSIYAYIS